MPVAKKIATTFRSLAQYADFSAQPSEPSPAPTPPVVTQPPPTAGIGVAPTVSVPSKTELGLVYRLEIHLPDTQNVETFRAIFKALREELMP